MMVGLSWERIQQGLKMLEMQQRGIQRTLRIVEDYNAPNVSEKDRSDHLKLCRLCEPHGVETQIIAFSRSHAEVASNDGGLAIYEVQCRCCPDNG